MTVIAQITTFPLDRGGSVSRYVKEAVKVLEESGYKYMVGPMSTSVEAETVEELLALFGKMHNAIANAGSQRIITLINIDDRRDKERGMIDKVKAVQPGEDSQG
jgi:uncharacterized protein (TIGR00106 family)